MLKLLRVACCTADTERGILICGSGVGASVAANKIPGIRAGLCHDSYSAHQGVEHDNLNVLVLGARVVADELAKDLCTIFLNARFTGEERHQRRLAKIQAIEQRYSHGSATVDSASRRRFHEPVTTPEKTQTHRHSKSRCSACRSTVNPSGWTISAATLSSTANCRS